MDKGDAGFMGKLQRLFSMRRTDAQEEPVPEREQAQPEQIVTDEQSGQDLPPPPPPPKPCLTWQAPADGATWLLWRLEHGGPDECPPLMLDIRAGLNSHEVLMDDWALEEELMLLARQLEKFSEQRYQNLQKLIAAMPHPDPQAAPAEETPPQAREDGEPPDGGDQPAGEAPPPRPDLDAGYFVYTARNGMAAWTFVFPPVGAGAAPAIDALAKALQKAGVSTGVEPMVVSRFVVEKPCFQLLPVAFGVPVREGHDGQIIERFSRENNREVVLDDAGNVDYRAQSYVRTIAKGDVICDILPPEPGIDGMRVDGKPVRASEVKPAKPPNGSNTTITPDGTQLIAAMDGHLEFSGSVFLVKSILEIPGDVDYSTGNIDFHGDVHIRGDVRENFSVRATGTVTIDGLVEAATVEAEGDIVISNGVLGDNKALIKSRGSVRAKYLENCVVYSGKCTFADCIMASQVYSDDRISVCTGRGTIIGGCLTAAHLIEANVIGSKSGRQTQIVLGALPYVEEEFRNNETELEAINTELIELEARLRYLEGKPTNDAGAKELAKLRLRRPVLNLKRDKLTKRQEELEQLTPDLSKCRLECGTIYPVARLTIGPATRLIGNEWVRCTAVYNEETHELVMM